MSPKTAKASEAVLNRMRSADPKLNWDKNPLPRIEVETRSVISGAKEHQLLFGTKGRDFVQALLVSQVEATKYAESLSKVLADQDPVHAGDLNHLRDEWRARHDETFRLLRNY